MVELLLAAGANVHAENDEPLSLASTRHGKKWYRIVKLLMAAGADAHAGPVIKEATTYGRDWRTIRFLLDVVYGFRLGDKEWWVWHNSVSGVPLLEWGVDWGADRAALGVAP